MKDNNNLTGYKSNIYHIYCVECRIRLEPGDPAPMCPDCAEWRQIYRFMQGIERCKQALNMGGGRGDE